MNPTYIATNQEELFDKSSPEIQQLIVGGEVDKVTAILGKIYGIPIGSYVSLSNIISYALIGAIEPKDILIAIQDILKLPEEDSVRLVKDLETSILGKVNIHISPEKEEDMVVLTFPTIKPKKEELRKEILDTTKRESALFKDQSTPKPDSLPPKEENFAPGSRLQLLEKLKPTDTKEPVILTPGSRSQLLEQLQVLDTIPNDEEVEARLDHIKEHLSTIEEEEENSLDSNIALKEFMFGEKGTTEVKAVAKAATYSRAPTKYNVDPYKELIDA